MLKWFKNIIFKSCKVVMKWCKKSFIKKTILKDEWLVKICVCHDYKTRIDITYLIFKFKKKFFIIFNNCI